MSNRPQHTRHFEGYMLGVITAIEVVVNGYDQPGIAHDIRRNLLTSITKREFRAVADEEALMFPRSFWGDWR